MKLSNIKKFVSDQSLLENAIIAHIIFIILHIIEPWLMTDNNTFNLIIAYGSMLSVIAICIFITGKTIQFFAHQHQLLILHYRYIGWIIESLIAAIVMILLFFNQEITTQFITFIIDVSKKTHNNEIIALFVVIALYFCIKLHHALEKKKHLTNTKSSFAIIKFHIVTLSLKLLIIAGIALGLLHPIFNILNDTQLEQFDTLMFHFTTTEFFVYIHTIIVILLGIWMCLGIYYLYTFYKKRN